MRILFISPDSTFPGESKENMKKIFQEKEIRMESSDKPRAEHKAAGYDAIILAGDENSIAIDDMDLLKNILYEFMKENKIVGAIDCAPVLLAMTGILEGKCATVNDTKELGRQIHKLGSLFFEESVVVDKNVVTANSPSAASEFANTLIELMNAEDLDNRITCN